MQHLNTQKSTVVFEIMAKELKKERLKQGKSIRTLAYENGLPISLISRLENCKNEPKIISIFSICQVLGIKSSELIKRIESNLPRDFSFIEQ